MDYQPRNLKNAIILLFAILVNHSLLGQVGPVIWEDNFNTFDTNVWTPDVGDGCPNLCGWGNQELEYYSPNNVTIEPVPGEPGNNALVLEAKNETIGGRAFTSGKVLTEGKLSIHYGMIEVRMMVPDLATGLWPAAWLLGTVNLTWPGKGEIDIMEMGHAQAERTRQGHPSSTVNNYVGANAIFATPEGPGSIAFDEGFNQPYESESPMNDRFMIYRLYWDPSELRFTVIDEGTEYDLYTGPLPIDPDGVTSAFTRPFYMLLNLAVGGNFTDAASNGQVTAPLPAKMYVDYVRVSEWNGHGEVAFDYESNQAESGVFGVFTDNTPTNNQLVLGGDGEVFGWEGTVQEGTIAPFEGDNVIAWQTSGTAPWFGGGITSLFGKDMSNYLDSGSLKFKIKIPGDVSFRIGITDNFTNETFLSFPAGETTYGLVRDGEWGEVEIPLTAFAGLLAFQNINYLFAITSDGALPPSPFDFAVDDVVWDDGRSSNVSISSIEIAPRNPVIDQGETLQFSAKAYDVDGNLVDAAFSWTATGGTISGTGLYSTNVSGDFVVTATSSGVSSTTNITVNEVETLYAIQLTPSMASIKIGETVQFNAQMVNENGDPVDAVVSWSSTGGNVSSSGLFTADEGGEYTVTAAGLGTTSSASVTVSERIDVPNECAGAAPNGDYTYVVSGTDQPEITFVPGYDGVGEGIVILYYGNTSTGGYPGFTITPNEPYTLGNTVLGETTYFYFTYSVPEGGERNTSNSRHSFINGNCVDDPIMVSSIEISPTISTLTLGESQQFFALALDQIGNEINTPFSWSSSGGVITSDGLFFANEVGEFIVTATSSGISASVSVFVEAPVANECDGTAINGDYNYVIAGGESPTITFHPGYTGVGSGVVILYYGNSASGSYPGYVVQPNVPFGLTDVNVNESIYFYYTYSVPEGGERNTFSDRHQFSVGACVGMNARASEKRSGEEMINEGDFSEPIIYPSLVSDKLYISFPSGEINKIHVIDISGKEVMRQSMRPTSYYLVSMDQIKSGNYILKILTDRGTFNQRIVKKSQ